MLWHTSCERHAPWKEERIKGRKQVKEWRKGSEARGEGRKEWIKWRKGWSTWRIGVEGRSNWSAFLYFWSHRMKVKMIRQIKWLTSKPALFFCCFYLTLHRRNPGGDRQIEKVDHPGSEIQASQLFQFGVLHRDFAYAHGFWLFKVKWKRCHKGDGWTGRTIQLTDQFYFHCAGSKKSEAEGKEKFVFDFDFSALIRRFSLGAYSWSPLEPTFSLLHKVLMSLRAHSMP